MRRTGSFLSDKRAPSASSRRGVSKLDARLHLYRCRIPLCRPVRPEVNIIDLIRTNDGIHGAAPFEKKAGCSTYPLTRQFSGKERDHNGLVLDTSRMTSCITGGPTSLLRS